MTAKVLILMLAFVAAASVAAADGTNETTAESPPDDKAWSDDCATEMCAADSGPAKGEGDGYNECDPAADCRYKGELCDDDAVYAEDEQPDCMPRRTTGGTCMDGAQEGEECQPDLYYMAPPANEGASPTDDKVTDTKGDDATAKNVPAPAVALGVVVVGAVAIMMAARRK